MEIPLENGVRMNWEIGDEFHFINGSLDGLSPLTGQNFTIASKVHRKGDNTPNDNGKTYVWFDSREGLNWLCYASVDNIRRLTKLERALK